MKHFFFPILLFLIVVNAAAQQHVIDSFKQNLAVATDDSVRFRMLLRIGELYAFNNADSSLTYIKMAIALAENERNNLWKAHTNVPVSYYFFVVGDIASALEVAFTLANDYENHQDAQLTTAMTTFIGILYLNSGNYKEAKNYAFKSIRMLDTVRMRNTLNSAHINSSREGLLIEDYMVLAMANLHFNKMDSALWYGRKACSLNVEKNLNNNYPLYRLGLIHAKIGNTDSALNYFKRAIPLAYKANLIKDVIDNYNGMADLFSQTSQRDSAVLYAYKVMNLSEQSNYRRGALEASLLLSRLYEKQGRNDSAFHYYKYAMATKDSLFNQGKIQQIQSFAFKEELKDSEIRQKVALEQEQYRNRIRVFAVLGIATALLSIALILWRNNRQKQKAKNKIELAYNRLQATQAQLIQSEKMASLGELTAGIAHEIQNPLNFVNNFSETNTELIQEAEEELKSGNQNETFALLADIKGNEQKIVHHGKRAEAIVKNMLEHSRTSKGERQLSDINALADEYLRLAYHGLRAKDKNFNAKIETHFDKSIGKVNIVPNDLGRVLLNLYNNAFYAVAEKQKGVDEAYEPVISVSSKRVNGRLEITISDNGTGIPKSIVDKVFQPFFTTKPTGQGTGLGLSLSYDIVKANGGELRVESKEGDSTTFTISLPAA
jgi:signal transduction histidine kinase